MGLGITFNAKNYYCICGRRGSFLNLNHVFGKKYGPAICDKCRDKVLKNEK